MTKKILWISTSVPYDTVPHAGGKCENFFIKKFKNAGGFDIHLLTLAKEDELNKIDLTKSGISYYVKVYGGSILRNAYRKVWNIGSAINPFHKNGHLIMSYELSLLEDMLNDYSKDNIPDIIVLEWSGTLLLLPAIKKIFPEAYTVIFEEDVSFQGFERKYRLACSGLKKKYLYTVYKKAKDIELSGVNLCNLIVVYNEKDRNLLLQNEIPDNKIFVVPPYYDHYTGAGRSTERKSILFYGAMLRKENRQCAEWIVSRIMPLLADTEIELEIVGKCGDELKRYENDKIHIRGFVEDITPFFERSICFVAPLLMGAGIKIKILEAMSAGITVLTNDIGIEGIPARPDEEYYHCENPEDYAEMIMGLYNGIVKELGDNARILLKRAFNTDLYASKLIDRIKDELRDHNRSEG